MSYHNDIENRLAYSEKLRGLAAGHQQETNQLLENIEQLQNDVRQLLNENDALRLQNAQKDKQIHELEQRNADLQNTNYTINGPYIETQNIHKFIQVESRKLARTKHKTLDTQNQLPLWPNASLM